MKNLTLTIAARALCSAAVVALLSILAVSCIEYEYESSDYPFIPPQNGTGSFVSYVRYDSIRSYPGGGGIFTIGIHPSSDFTGSVWFNYNSNPLLNVSLNRLWLTSTDTVAELMIWPSAGISQGDQTILLEMHHNGIIKSQTLKVEIYNWSGPSGQYSHSKLLEFKSWILQKDPTLAGAFGNPLMHYFTYPEVLIVEHHTFITQAYEVRLCYHVMVPPYDWSMVLIRPLNTDLPVLAAKRYTDGTIEEIDISQYPLMFGY